jgi:hypothetical protein
MSFSAVRVPSSRSRRPAPWSAADLPVPDQEARRAFLIGQAVRERWLALGLSQTEVAARAA